MKRPSKGPNEKARDAGHDRDDHVLGVGVEDDEQDAEDEHQEDEHGEHHDRARQERHSSSGRPHLPRPYRLVLRGEGRRNPTAARPRAGTTAPSRLDWQLVADWALRRNSLSVSR